MAGRTPRVPGPRGPAQSAGLLSVALAALCAIVMAACTGDGAAPPAPAPVIRQVLPERARTDGQVFLVIRGEGFQPGVTVQVGDRTAGRATWVNAQTVTAVLSPPLDPGEREVRVTNPDGGTAAMPAAMVLEAPPRPQPPSGSGGREDDGDGGFSVPTFDLDDLLDLLDRLRSGLPGVAPPGTGNVSPPGQEPRGRN